MAEQIKADGGGLRFNGGKNQLELIPPEWILAVGEVMTVGAVKYQPRNWERGMAWSIMIGCCLRHLFKFASGQSHDEETGCHHLAHVAWNALALMTYDVKQIGTNDLPLQALVKPTKVVVTQAETTLPVIVK